MSWTARVPADWRVISPRRHFRERKEASGPEDVHLTPSQHHGVLPQTEYMAVTGSKVVLNLVGADSMKHVEPGDAIAHLRSFQGGLETAWIPGKVSTAYTVIEPLGQAEPRYFRWVFKCSGFVQELASSVQQLRDGQSVKFGDLAGIPVPLPSLGEQRRIADFLDDRVARIDRIIAARHQQVSAVTSGLDATWGQLAVVMEERFGLTPLRRFLVSIADGPFGSSLTSSHYSDQGTRVLRLGNIGVGEFRDDDKAFIPDGYAATLSTHSVEAGDLVMAGLGDERWPLGRCVVVPPDLGPAIVKADCYRIRLDDRIHHDFAALFLSSPPARGRSILHARGATRARLNTEVARGMELPPADSGSQSKFVQEVHRVRERSATMIDALAQTIDLLTEYKTSLITAAVTGELDVTTVGSGMPNA